MLCLSYVIVSQRSGNDHQHCLTDCLSLLKRKASSADAFVSHGQKELAEALLKKFEERPQLQGGLDGICRLLLTADTYSVPLLRDHCLHRLAARFADLVSRTAPQHEQTLFAQFLQAIAPTVGFNS